MAQSMRGNSSDCARHPDEASGLRGFVGVVQLFHRLLHLGREGFHVVPFQACGWNRLADPHFQRTALDVVSVHGQQFVGSDQRDGNDVGLGFDSEKKGSGHQGFDFAVWRATTFRKNDERHAASQTLHGGSNLAHGSGRLLLIHADLAGALEMPADDGIRQQFALEQNPELKWKVGVKNRNIERRGMIDRVDVRLCSIDLLQADHLHGGEDRLHDEFRPDAREIVQDALFVAKKRNRNRNQTHHDRVKPDQRIEDEIGPQPAEEAMTGLCGGGLRYALGGTQFDDLRIGLQLGVGCLQKCHDT